MSFRSVRKKEKLLQFEVERRLGEITKCSCEVSGENGFSEQDLSFTVTILRRHSNSA